jgi:hypothetical protein
VPQRPSPEPKNRQCHRVFLAGCFHLSVTTS